MTNTHPDTKNIIVPAVLSGRCANGFERGQGVIVHAVMCDESELRVGLSAYRALCGKAHGAKSAGWSDRRELTITCPKCLKAISESDKKLISNQA